MCELRFLEARTLTLMGAPCLVMRSGYSGEDGFEISTPADLAREIAEELLADPNVAPAGLGARDSLRLEAGLPLYGSDLDEGTTPVEAGLAWAIPRPRRSGGAREGGFPGAEIILDQTRCMARRGAAWDFVPRAKARSQGPGHAPSCAKARRFTPRRTRRRRSVR